MIHITDTTVDPKATTTAASLGALTESFDAGYRQECRAGRRAPIGTAGSPNREGTVTSLQSRQAEGVSF